MRKLLTIILLSTSILLILVAGCSSNKNSISSYSITPTSTFIPTTTDIPITTGSEIRILPHANMNMFIAPEIHNQQKSVTIWSDADWRLSYDADWLKVSPTRGTSLQNTRVWIKINDVEMSPGEYKTEIVVESEDSSLSKIIPVTLYVITEMPEQILDIPVEINMINILPGAIDFSTSSVKAGLLERNIFHPFDGGVYAAGDPCIIVTGEFTNNTENNTYLFVRAEGYDNNGVQKSWSMAYSGPTPGREDYDLPAYGNIDMEIILSWANESASIRIFISIISMPEV